MQARQAGKLGKVQGASWQASKEREAKGKRQKVQGAKGANNIRALGAKKSTKLK